jgi:hypothetical protein
MIVKHVDIWAVLILLFVFALFTRADHAVIRLVRAKVTFSDRVYPVEVRISPWHLNRYQAAPRHVIPSCRMI